MSLANALYPTTPISERPSRVAYRTRGRRHGPITRLMSPSDLGEMLKPFVFLDLVDAEARALSGFGLHPHSGIATVTYLFEGDVRYEDSTGASGLLPAGGVEWFKAARGAWHGGGAGVARRARGFQLWLALPPEQELGPVESIYLTPEDIAQDGPARVLVGALGAAVSSLNAPASINYLAVRLKVGETWRYQRPADHTVAWLALAKGNLTQIRAPFISVLSPKVTLRRMLSLLLLLQRAGGRRPRRRRSSNIILTITQLGCSTRTGTTLRL
jgi:redox-sensitive bicupin YhaK (pirin superfamily)